MPASPDMLKSLDSTRPIAVSGFVRTNSFPALDPDCTRIQVSLARIWLKPSDHPSKDPMRAKESAKEERGSKSGTPMTSSKLKTRPPTAPAHAPPMTPYNHLRVAKPGGRPANLM